MRERGNAGMRNGLGRQQLPEAVPPLHHFTYCLSNTCVYPFTTSVSTLFVSEP
jgi:hypothetical protein